MERVTHAIALVWLLAAGAYMLSEFSPFSPDSYVYVAAATSLTQNGTLAVPFAPTTASALPVPYAAWPPGYPASIALLAQTGMSIGAAARLLSALGLLGGILLFWRFTRQATGAALAVFMVAVSSQTATIGTTAWSEGLFFAAIMGSAWAMSKWLEGDTGKMRFLCIAAGCAAVAIQMRYAGVFLIPALIQITWLRGLRLQRIAGTCLHLMAGVPLLLWFIRNANVAANWRGGSTTSAEWWRAPAELGLSVARLCGVSDLGFPALGAIVGALLLVALSTVLYRNRSRLTDDPAVLVSVAFFLALTAGTVLARALGHLWILDARMMWPAWAFAIFLGVRAGSSFLQRSHRWPLALMIVWMSLQTFSLSQSPSREAFVSGIAQNEEFRFPNRSADPLLGSRGWTAGLLLCNQGWTAWHLTGQANYHLPFAHYRGDLFHPDTLLEWAAKRNVRLALWIDEKRSDEEIESMYGPLGLLMAHADSSYFTVNQRKDGVTWMFIHHFPPHLDILHDLKPKD